MQQLLKDLLAYSFKEVSQHQGWHLDSTPLIQIDRCRDAQHGDFASNFALIMSKPIGIPSKKLAELIIDVFPRHEQIATVNVAGPGFINFTMSPAFYHGVLLTILATKKLYGRSDEFKGQRLHLEFVSANPTGPLHVGHGRSAAYAACVGNLLAAIGYEVHREYYVNDAGRQMRILALSTWLRYLQLLGETVQFPANAYQGDYIKDIAKTISHDFGALYLRSNTDIMNELTSHVYVQSDPEAMIDAYIAAAQRLIGNEAFAKIQKITLETILQDIRDDLTQFGVEFNNWFYESQLADSGLIERGISLLREHGHVYERDGAVWFRATHFGDEKDRVLIRENGQSTYFASDVAYHLHKYNQDYAQIIDVFGADHHGYIARIRAFLQGLGKDPEKLKILLVQFVSLFRGANKISMSTRSGSFVTLRELRQEVGNDATKFFYIFRKPEQHLDFDLELAKKQSNDNPVYYVQYAHARIASIWRQLQAQGLQWDEQEGTSNLNLLATTQEQALLREIAYYPRIVQLAALQYAPHLVAHYIHELAHLFHSYYNGERFILEDAALRNARLCLIFAVQQVVANGLNVLGITALEQM